MPVIQETRNYTVTTSAQKIIKRALRLLAVKATGQELEPEELADGLEVLNGMLDTWNTDSLMVPSRTQIEMALNGSASYTIGEDAGNDIVTFRPQDIRQGDAYIRLPSGIEYTLEVYTHEMWGKIWKKNYTGMWPYVLYYDKAFPNGNINLWPIASSGTLILHQEKKLAQITQPTVPFNLEPAYYEAICYNLAIRWAPEWGVKSTQETVAIAQSTLLAIKRLNSVDPVMSCDPAILNKSVLLDGFGYVFGGGATPSPTTSAITTTGTVPGNYIWLVEECTGGVSGITRTLPDPTQGAGHIITFIKMDAAAGAITISGSMNVGLSYALVNVNQNITLISDGTQWVVQAAN